MATSHGRILAMRVRSNLIFKVGSSRQTAGSLADGDGKTARRNPPGLEIQSLWVGEEL